MLASTSTNERCGVLNDKTAFLKQLYGKEEGLAYQRVVAYRPPPPSSSSSLRLGLNSIPRHAPGRTSPVNDLLRRKNELRRELLELDSEIKDASVWGGSEGRPQTTQGLRSGRLDSTAALVEKYHRAPAGIRTGATPNQRPAEVDRDIREKLWYIDPQKQEVLLWFN